jgi:hypothetical protein
MKHASKRILVALLTAISAAILVLAAAPAEPQGEGEITALCEKYSSAYKGQSVWRDSSNHRRRFPIRILEMGGTSPRPRRNGP